MSVTSKELKRRARAALEGHYFPATNLTISITFYTLAMSYLLQLSGFGVSTQPIHQVCFWVLWAIMSLLGSLFEVGLVRFLYIMSRRGETRQPGVLFYAFKHQPDTFILVFAFRYLLVLIWFIPAFLLYMRIPIMPGLREFLLALLPVLLLALVGAVPAAILALPYCLSTYILLDQPYLSAREALRQSRMLMKGHKGRLLAIWISFIPLVLIGFGSYGLGFLWIRPYYHTTMNQFYLSLSSQAPVEMEM